MEGIKDRIIKRCPKCGGRIVVSHLYQTSHNHTITQKGKISKGFKRDGEHSMECSIASCVFAPDKCDVSWNADDFYIDSEDRFHDLKYGEDQGVSCIRCKHRYSKDFMMYCQYKEGPLHPYGTCEHGEVK